MPAHPGKYEYSRKAQRKNQQYWPGKRLVQLQHRENNVDDLQNQPAANEIRCANTQDVTPPNFSDKIAL